MIRNLFITICILGITTSCFAISASDTINASNFNHRLFEKTLHQKINQYRKQNGLNPLINNVLISKVAKNQLDYIVAKNTLTHNQANPKKRSVTDRLEFYTQAKNYKVAENLAQTFVLTRTKNYISNGTTQIGIAYTYEEAATYMLNAWIASKAHNKNILTPEYEISGLTVYFNPKTVTAVQVFAKFN